MKRKKAEEDWKIENYKAYDRVFVPFHSKTIFVFSIISFDQNNAA